MVAYRCPFCGTSILSMVGVFALSGDLIKLKCDCGDSELTLMRQPNDRVKISVPCVICPNQHVYTISTGSFFSTDLLTLACPMSGINVLFIGKEQQVRDALDETERELDRLLEEAELDNFSGIRGANGEDLPDEVDAELVHLANFVISELEEDDAIECECTENGERGDYDFETDGHTIVVYCKNCDCEKAFPIDTQSQLEAFALCDTMKLRRPKN